MNKNMAAVILHLRKKKKIFFKLPVSQSVKYGILKISFKIIKNVGEISNYLFKL